MVPEMSPTSASPTDEPSAVDHYTLHMFPFSLYSIMSRFTYILGKSHLPTDAPLIHQSRLDLKLVNLHRYGNISEEYPKINPKGQVPALCAFAFVHFASSAEPS
ncbi:hypothetical protein J3458_003500 [Metarhizium acridum]|uniref:uncharacterized protein n=1 Tax=Metarhizium acridum TaxID=92637 RepID=UPI001C6BF743|nr:hypothetical protein J3458_003500 [Metarhizium acridum]